MESILSLFHVVILIKRERLGTWNGKRFFEIRRSSFAKKQGRLSSKSEMALRVGTRYDFPIRQLCVDYSDCESSHGGTRQLVLVAARGFLAHTEQKDT